MGAIIGAHGDSLRTNHGSAPNNGRPNSLPSCCRRYALSATFGHALMGLGCVGLAEFGILWLVSRSLPLRRADGRVPDDILRMLPRRRRPLVVKAISAAPAITALSFAVVIVGVVVCAAAS